MTKTKNILMIIAAGDSTRMGFLPKAASIINGKPNLYRTVELAYDYFDYIFIASNTKNYEFYHEIVENFNDKAIVLTIRSGRGCGHAVLKTMNVISKFDDVQDIGNTIICWGDVYFMSGEIFKELKIKNAVTSAPLLIPVVEENDPYVWFNFDNNRLIHSMFKKRGETTVRGIHDQSIFGANFYKLKEHLTTIHNVLDKNETYLNNEMVFLDAVNYMWNIGDSAQYYITGYKTMAYNDESELREVNKLIRNFKKKK